MGLMDSADRLWLLSMMALGGLPGCSDDANGTDDSSTGTGTTGSANSDTAVDEGMTPDSDSTAGQADDDSTSGGSDTGLPGTSSGDGLTDSGTTGDSGSTGDSGTTGDSSTGDESSSSSTTSVEPLSPLVEACVDLYTTYQDCYGGYGYSDEEIVGLCMQTETYTEMYEGENCVTLVTEHMVCLSSLSCRELENNDFFDGPCSKTYANGNAECPEAFAFCEGGGGGGGPDGCELESSGCLDGNTYGVACDAMTCTCLLNGVEGDTFASPGADACFDENFGDGAAAACGFPAGIFF